MLAARAAFPGESLAALYDPGTMPPALARLEFLFGLYQQLSAPLLGAAPKVKAKSRAG